MDDPTCQRCGNSYTLRDGCEPTPECDRCAQAALGDLRAKLRSYLAEPSIDGRTVRQAMRADLAHQCRENL